MRKVFSDLGRNLVAGARLALGLRVSLLSFRVSVGSLLALLAVFLLLDIALDWVRLGPSVRFSPWALPNIATYTGATLIVTAVLAIAFDAPHLLLAIPVMSFAAAPLVDVANFGYRLLVAHPVRSVALMWLAYATLWAWSLFITARVLVLALPPRPHAWARVAVGVVALTGASIVLQTAFGDRDWWYADTRAERRGYDYWAAVSEQALAKQPALFATALAGIASQRPGVVDLYFVGFAPYASQDVFRKDVELAKRVVESRFDAAGRSIALVNNPRTVLEQPLATVTNLRAALKAVGDRIDPDEDVVLVFLTSHGHRNVLASDFPPLRLDSLTPAALRSMLDDAGIKWRIVVISACYSGSFIPALADERTLVLTAASSERQSFGCADDSDLTYFTDALFNHALRDERSLPAAFEMARKLIADRERAEGLSPPSDPQMSLGSAVADKLAALEGRSRASAAGACAAGAC
jgi:hypothetical protein